MKKIQFFNFLLLITTVSSCQNKQSNIEKEPVKTKPECEILYSKYLDKLSIEEKDSALYYIDKCIQCDTTQKDNIHIKVQLLISMNEYKNAILALDNLLSNENEPTLKFQKGVLLLKINDSNSLKILEESYTEFREQKKPTSSNKFYKIALDNYFKGKDYSLFEIEKFKNNYKDKGYELQNINALEFLIKNETKENVLYKIFNIN